MLLPRLREEVLEANLELVRRGLVLYTFGNASGISRDQKLVVIKPSGVPYDKMKPEHLVVTDLEGKMIEGDLRPSSDLPTHLVLYQAFLGIGGVAHTHSDYFYGTVPVTGVMKDAEITSEYEKNTGHAIVRAFEKVDYTAVPAVLVANHGPFAWGPDSATAAHNAAILEAVARMAYFTLTIHAGAEPVAGGLHDKHYLRKHGSNAYYGQAKERK